MDEMNYQSMAKFEGLFSKQPQLSIQNQELSNTKINKQLNEKSLSKKQVNLREKKKDENNHEHTPHLMITDLAMHYNELNEFDLALGEEDTESNKKFLKFFYNRYRNLDQWVLLFVLAIITPTLSVSFCFISNKMLGVLCFFIDEHAGDEEANKVNVYQKIYYFFIGLALSITLACTSTFICSFQTDSEGSGIPELKSILAGISIYRYLQFKTLVTKIFGLFFAVSAGLTIGREGPFVHISAAIASNLTKFKFFSRLYEKSTFRKQILATAGGIGITATFGSPIGGCLYSIETMSTFFPVGNFWKSFFCSFVCAFVFHVYKNLINMEFWPYIPFGNFEIDFTLNKDIIAFAFLGVICGLIGPIHINLIKFFILTRRKIKNKYINRYGWLINVCLITTIVSYFFTPFGVQNEVGAKKLFLQEYIDNGDIQNNIGMLIGIILLKFLTNALALSSAIPSGIFVPMFLIGGIIGRAYGVLMLKWFGITKVTSFAVVGSACLVSSVTHTLAITVITFELVGQINILYEVLIGVVIAYAISKYFSPSIYHVSIDIKNLPFLPQLLDPHIYQLMATDIMDNDLKYLTPNSSFDDIAMILAHVQYTVTEIPIMSSMDIEDDDQQLLYSVQSGNLRHYLRKQVKEYQKKNAHKKINNADIERGKARQRQQSKYTSELFKSRRNKQLLGSAIDSLQINNLPKDIKELSEIPDNDPFWQQTIDIHHPLLNIERAPFTVQDNINVARVHFLFSMLGLHYVYVLSKGKVAGLITANSFQFQKNQRAGITQSLLENQK